MPAARIRYGILAMMRQETEKTPGEECCGLLAGQERVISAIFPARNIHPEPSRAYEIAPKEIFRIMREIRARGLELLGIYHSHPRGENRPSPTDIEQAFYPDTPYFILSPLPDAARSVRAFLLCDGETTELKIEIAP